MLETETIVRGRTWSVDWVHYDVYLGEGNPGNVPTNHTGWSVRAQIRTKLPGKPGKPGRVIANLDVTFPSPTAGTVAIRHDRDFTRSLALSKAGELWFDCVATDPDGLDHIINYPEPIDIVDWPTDPEDDSSDDFIPGGGGAIHHTHPFSQITGFESGITAISIDADGRLHVLKSGVDYAYTPFSVTP